MRHFVISAQLFNCILDHFVIGDFFFKIRVYIRGSRIYREW